MRYLIFSLLTLLGTTATQAQKFEIGVNGGIGFNTKPDITAEHTFFSSPNDHSGFTPVASVKAMWNHNKWQYGVEAGFRELSYKPNNDFGPLFVIGGSYESLSPTPQVFISKAAFPIKAFANRKFAGRHFESYVGISAGYVLATQCEDPNALAEKYFDKVNGNGFSVGVHGGTTWFFSKRMGLNAELGADYMILTVGAATYKLVAFPGTLGLRYKI